MNRRGLRALFPLVLIAAAAGPAGAYTVDSGFSDPCHELMIGAAYQDFILDLPTTGMQAPPGETWRELSDFLLEHMPVNPEEVDEVKRFILVSLIVGVRSPDTDGHSVMNLQNLAVVDELTQKVAGAAQPDELETILAELRALSARLVEENPFERSGQTRSLIRLIKETERYLQNEPGPSGIVRDRPREEVLRYFWSLQPIPQRIPGRVKFFNARLEPLLAVNFYRSYDLSGQLTDHFWKIDLPFLLFFAADFLIG